MPVLTATDLLGIQRFVFASRRLRDVIGASLLVARACSSLGDGPIAQHPAAHRLMAAGGNALLRFDDLSAARDFAKRYTRWLHDTAPGLEAVVVHRAYHAGELARAIRALHVDLARAKLERIPSAPLAGLSVTETCHETGLPAVEVGRLGGQRSPVSRATLAVRAAWKRDRDRSPWVRDLTRIGDRELVTLARPRELDDLGRSQGDTSILAVVHIDGNRIGRSISTWLDACVGEDCPDADLWTRFDALSRGLDILAEGAMKRVMDRVARSLVTRVNDGAQRVTSVVGTVPDLAFTLRPAAPDAELGDEAGVCLPVWPVLVGGDDLTFVCDGRLALDLTEAALGAFEASRVPELGRVTASAGVAMVRSHAPFSRAYDLAEALCREAKQRWDEGEHSRRGCALDWHLGEVRPGERVSALRDRQYDGGRLTARPMLLGDAVTPGTWRWLDAALLSPDGEHSFRNPAVWGERRNKVKVLREALRQGGGAVERALEAWQKVDAGLRLPPRTETGARTPLLDAIELIDVHAPLALRDEEAP
jgi:hypothetical protein